jgi:sigma-B regulation protein RsbU (phosphoserine phosphatase)
MISYSFQVFYDNSSRGQPMNTSDSSRLATMTPFLTGISKRLDGLVLWHCTVLKNGVTAVFPGHGIAARFNPMQERWYTKALQRDDFWSQQFRDPFSGRNVLAFSMPVRDPGGRVIGATAFMIPTRRLLEGREILAHLPRATQSFLIGLVQNPATGKAGARILADQALGADGRATWTSPFESDWLVADAPGQQSGVMQDLEQGRRNIRRVRYQDCDCLWVYGPVHQDAFLLFTTPYHEILQPIDEDESFIRGQIDELLGITRLGILFILAAVVALAFAFARTVSKPMQILAEGARRLAEGHLDTRVDIRSRDEFGDMGKVFNEVGPQLEAHARFQQTMTLAREVQQHFLPGRAPVVPGLDIAGKSQYCDEVGGDYFDFIEPDDGSNRIGVVIGDVSGHGIPSALLMTTARALLRQRASLSGSIDQVIADVNLRLCRDIEESGQFMTLFYAELLPDQKALHWLRAGHDPALLYHPDTDRFQQLMGEGTTLGVSCDIRFEAYRQSLKSGQILLLTTDGIREARHPDGHMFGNASLRRIVRENAGSRADQILEAIMMELKSFSGPQAKLEDDATVVVVKVT